jgi:hypothetical protein
MVLPSHGPSEAFSRISPVTSLNWFVNLHKQSHSLKGRFVGHRNKTKALTWKSTCLRQQFCEIITSQWAYVNYGGIVNLCWETQCWILWSWNVILVCGVGDYPLCCLPPWVMMDTLSCDAIQVCGVRDCTMCQLWSQATKQYLKFTTSLAPFVNLNYKSDHNIDLPMCNYFLQNWFHLNECCQFSFQVLQNWSTAAVYWDFVLLCFGLNV